MSKQTKKEDELENDVYMQIWQADQNYVGTSGSVAISTDIGQ